MDIIGSNVQINLGITAKKDGLRGLKDQIIEIDSLLTKLSGKTFTINLALSSESAKSISGAGKLIEKIKKAGAGAGAGTGTKSPLSGFIAETKKVKGGLEEIKIRMLELEKVRVHGNKVSGGLRGPVAVSEVTKGALGDDDPSSQTTATTYASIEGSLERQRTITKKIVKDNKGIYHTLIDIKEVQKNIADQVERQSVKSDMMKQINEGKKIAEIQANQVKVENKIKHIRSLGYKHLKSTTTQLKLAGTEVTTTASQWVKQFKDGRISMWKLNEQAGTLVQTIEKSAKAKAKERHEGSKLLKVLQEQTRLEEIRANIAARQPQLMRLRRAGFRNAEDPKVFSEKIGGETVHWKAYKLVRDLKDGRQQTVLLNESLKKTEAQTHANAEAMKKWVHVGREMKKAAAEVRREMRIEQQRSIFMERTSKGGYQMGESSKYYDAVKKQSGEILTAHRWQREGLAKYSVELMRFNTLTGIMTTEMKQGAAAAKFLGDSMFRAGEKVFIWTASTTVIFTAIRAIKGLFSAVAELEANTIFLARVSDRLVMSTLNEAEAFKLKLAIARRITSATIDLTQAIGGSAQEAQKAAAVFLRAGIAEKEVIYGVTAALLASKIAEMEVGEAAEMMVSAIRQFNVEARELLPTLDTLNSLSNNWKVSTNDLLQAISRAGSVFASHNGTISELAAMTAVIGQRTSRTGTQIGNALKTIESRMDRLEVSKRLFQDLGTSTVQFSGEARSLMQTILELSTRMDQLTEAEQKELTVAIAGVRQRNILVAALAESDTAFVALNKSMFESGSAYGEFLEASKTLTAALERLKANLTAIADDTRGWLGSIMTGTINAINSILRLVDALGSSPIVVTLMVGAFFILRMTLGKLLIYLKFTTKEFLGLKVSMSLLDVQSARLGHRISRLSLRFRTLTRTMATSRAMLRSVGASAASFLTIGNLMTAALSAAVIGYTMYASSQASNVALLEDYNTMIDLSISKEKKRMDAIMLTNSALNILYVEMDTVNKKLKEGIITQDEYIKNMDDLKDSVKKIVASLDIDIRTDFGDKSNEEIRQELQTKFDDSFDAYIHSLRSGISRTKAELADAKEELLAAEKKFYQVKIFGITGTGMSFGEGKSYPEKIVGKEIGSVRVTPLNARAAEEALAKEAARIRKDMRDRGLNPDGADFKSSHDDSYMKRRLKEIEQAIEHIRMLAAEYDKAKQAVSDFNETLGMTEELLADIEKLETEELKIEFKALFNNIKNVVVEMDKFKDLMSKVDKYNSAIGRQKTYKDLREDFIVLNEQIDEFAETIIRMREISKGLAEKEIAEWIKKLDEAKKKAIEVAFAMAKASRQITGFTESSLDTKAKIQDSLYKNRLKRAQALRDTMSEIKDIEETMLDIEISKARIKKHMSDAVNFKGKNDIETAAVRAGYGVKVQEELVKLKDYEIEKTQKIFEIETAILIAKREQTKEAMKAIGQLDNEAKLRLIAQAQYFLENPDKKIGIAEEFRSGTAGNAIRRQFFASKTRPLEEENDPLARLIIDSGAGLTPELVAAEKDIARLREGAGPESDIANKGYRTAQEYDRQARQANGDDLLTSEDAIRGTELEDQGLMQRPEQIFNLSIDENSFSLAPLTDVFTEFLDVTVKAEFQRMMTEVIEGLDNKYKPRVASPVN